MARETKTLEKHWGFSEFWFPPVQLRCEEGSSEEEVQTYYITPWNENRALGSMAVWCIEPEVGLSVLEPDAPALKPEEATFETYAAIWRRLLEMAADKNMILFRPEGELGAEGDASWQWIRDHESTQGVGVGYQARMPAIQESNVLSGSVEEMAPVVVLRPRLHR